MLFYPYFHTIFKTFIPSFIISPLKFVVSEAVESFCFDKVIF